MDMVIDGFYALRSKVENEHQDHAFTYPEGLCLRLEWIEPRPIESWHTGYNKDGSFEWREITGHEHVYHFITNDGHYNVFGMEDLRPATVEEFHTCKVRVIIEPLGYGYQW